LGWRGEGLRLTVRGVNRTVGGGGRLDLLMGVGSFGGGSRSSEVVAVVESGAASRFSVRCIISVVDWWFTVVWVLPKCYNSKERELNVVTT
jgi:hypothetical protein